MSDFADRFYREVEAAAEHARDRETEQAHSCDGVNCGPVECEAEAYADTLGRLHEAYVFDGLITMYAKGPHFTSTPELHVRPDYFSDNFGDRADIEHEPMPAQSCIRKSVIHSGVKIFCLEDATFQVVA